MKNHEEILYCVTIWILAAMCGASRCVRNGSFKSLWHLVSVASVSGFTGFAVVAISGSRYGDADFDHLFWMGVACVVGLAGKEQTALISAVWRGVIGRIVPEAIGDNE